MTARFDLCDSNGQLRGIGRLEATDSVLPLVTSSETYVTVLFDYPITGMSLIVKIDLFNWLVGLARRVYQFVAYFMCIIDEDYVPYIPLLDSNDKLHEKIIGKHKHKYQRLTRLNFI